MQTLDVIRTHAFDLPLMAKFALAMALLLGTPRACRALGLPSAVGLLLAGSLFGPHGLNMFALHPVVAGFFSDLGELLLMFFIGLEIDLAVLREARKRALAFSLGTTLLPQFAGTAISLAFGFGLVPSVVIGSLLSPHTLIGMPIVSAAGLGRGEAVGVTGGGTVISDTLSLIIFAICVNVFVVGFSLDALAGMLVQIAGFVACLFWVVGPVGRYLLRRLDTEEEGYFVLLLMILALSGVMADLISLPGIVGAFLAGLAVNSAVQDKPAAAKLNFVADSLFIPAFFLVTGVVIDPIGFISTMQHQFAFVAGILVALLAGKWAATQIAGRSFGYPQLDRAMMLSLTIPHVAATLAATLVARRTMNASGQPLLDDGVVNVMLAIVLVTATVGPILTSRIARRMTAPG